MTGTERWPDAGFTLIEVLLAVVILGFGVASIISVFGSGLDGARWSADRTRGALQARSVMESALRSQVLEEITIEDQDESYTWTIEVTLEDTLAILEEPSSRAGTARADSLDASPPLEAYAVRVTVEWPVDEPRSRFSLLTLQSQRVAQEDIPWDR